MLQIRSDERYNPKFFADRWLKRAERDTQRIKRERAKFEKLSGGVGTTRERDKVVASLQKKRAIPVTQFSLQQFAKRFRLLHAARMADAKGRVPGYSEPKFSELARVLENSRGRDGTLARSLFSIKHDWESEALPTDIDMDRLRSITKKCDLLEKGHPAKPRAASEWVRERLARIKPLRTWYPRRRVETPEVDNTLEPVDKGQDFGESCSPPQPRVIVGASAPPVEASFSRRSVEGAPGGLGSVLSGHLPAPTLSEPAMLLAEDEPTEAAVVCKVRRSTRVRRKPKRRRDPDFTSGLSDYVLDDY